MVTLRLRFDDFSRATRSHTLPEHRQRQSKACGQNENTVAVHGFLLRVTPSLLERYARAAVTVKLLGNRAISCFPGFVANYAPC